MTKLHFTRSHSVSVTPFDLVHIDVWGPAPETFINGLNYYVFFVDNFSKFTWLYSITRKYDVFAVFYRFKPCVENIFSAKIKTLRTDEGGEFVNHSLTSFLHSNGIIHQKSCAYTPEKNGVAERKHRHIIQVVLSLMSQASLPTKFWSYAFTTATYLIN